MLLSICVYSNSGEVYSIQHYVLKFVSHLWQVGGILLVLHQQNWPSQYNWNIVEIAVKHHNPNPYPVWKWLHDYECVHTMIASNKIFLCTTTDNVQCTCVCTRFFSICNYVKNLKIYSSFN